MSLSKLLLDGAAASIVTIPTIGGARLRGNSQYVTGATGVRTGHFKIEYEQDSFTHVRVCIGNKYNTGVIGTWIAVVGNTDTVAVDTVSNAYLPQQNGVVNNARVALSSNGPGWRDVTWNGASSVDLPLSAGANNYATYVKSDWIPMASLPRVDVPGGRAVALLRACQINASGGYTQGGESGTGLQVYVTARGLNSWWREFFATTTSNDAVTNLNNNPANVTNIGNEPYAWLEFRNTTAKGKVRNWAVVGDSREENAVAVYALNSWSRVGLMELSTELSPMTHENFSGSGHSQTQYIQLINNALDQGYRFTDLLLPGFSQNGFGQTPAAAAAFNAANQVLIDRMRSYGTRIWLTTDYGVNGYNGTAEASRQICINYAKNLGTLGQAVVIDTDASITDYVTTPTAPVIKSIYNTNTSGTAGTGDGIHVGPPGQRVLSDLLKAAIIANP